LPCQLSCVILFWVSSFHQTTVPMFLAPMPSFPPLLFPLCVFCDAVRSVLKSEGRFLCVNDIVCLVLQILHATIYIQYDHKKCTRAARARRVNDFRDFRLLMPDTHTSFRFNGQTARIDCCFQVRAKENCHWHWPQSRVCCRHRFDPLDSRRATANGTGSCAARRISTP